MTKTKHNDSAAARFSARDLCGIVLPITTPFLNNGALDLVGLRANLRRWNETGIDGYVLLGSTGERVHLDEAEYLEVVAMARDEVSSDKVFIVGVGQQSTRGTINEIRRFVASVPIDAALVITPHFYRTSITQDTLRSYYQEIADRSPVPLILYSMPALTGIRIEPETAARLSGHENIIGIKDSSAEMEALGETVKLVRDDFAVLTGNGTVLREALDAGACGGILAVGCVASDLCIAIFRAVNSGDRDRAVALQARLSPLAEAVTVRFGIGGLKAAMDINGYVGGAVRSPLRSPDNDARQEIRRRLEDAGNAMRGLSARQPEAPLGA